MYLSSSRSIENQKNVEAMQILTVRCKLDGSDADRAETAAAVEAFAQACRYVARETPDVVTSRSELQSQCDRPIREQFALSANLARRAIARTAGNPKTAKTTRGSVNNYRD